MAVKMSKEFSAKLFEFCLAENSSSAAAPFFAVFRASAYLNFCRKSRDVVK
jgi:hypothetical protein